MLSATYSKKIVLVCALASATQGMCAEDYITKKTIAAAAFGGFILCSWRLFQKKAPEGELKYTVNDILKVWNIMSSDYWSAFDEQVIGTPEKSGDDVTKITYDEETDTIEMRSTKEKKRLATGLFGFYIYKSLLEPLKKISEYLKPLQELASHSEKFLSNSYFK